MLRTSAYILPVLVCLTACSEDKVDAAATPSQPKAAIAPEPQSAELPKAEARVEKIENDTMIFDYQYPAQAAAIPQLKALLDADLEGKRGSLAHDAREGKADAEANDYPYRPYALGYNWQVVAELPRWLSLSAGVFTDTGGAHPNHGYDALLWDKSARLRRQATELFVSKDALSNAIRKPFCALLDKQRAERRGVPVDPSSGNEFDQCIDPVAETVILGSSDGQTFNRIGVLVGPYSAGPYAEGDYEVTLPVTGPVMRALKPQYRSSFSVSR